MHYDPCSSPNEGREEKNYGISNFEKYWGNATVFTLTICKIPRDDLPVCLDDFGFKPTLYSIQMSACARQP
jgi:hypothetical protein